MEKHVSFESFLQKAGKLIAYDSPKNLQVNITRKCNLACKHCHLSCSPICKEDMSFEVAEAIIDLLKTGPFDTLDITGGAPEMSRVYRYLIDEASKLNKKIISRSNLTIYLEEDYKDLPAFLKERKVEIVSSLPFYEEKKTDRQRGLGVYQGSIKALKLLNSLGYGKDDKLRLNLVYNPGGAFLPGDQDSLEDRYRQVLQGEYDIYFNDLYTITNAPLGRYNDWLIRSGNYEGYMNKLIAAYNQATLPALMCLNMISVDYNGDIYDCDFNLALGLHVRGKKNITRDKLTYKREVVTGLHCYSCTAGSGSS